MENLESKLKESGLAEGSIKLYLSNLHTLNRKLPFTNLNFLKKTKDIEDIIRGYSESTQKSFLSSIITTLNVIDDKTTFKKTYAHYTNLLAKYRKNTDKPASGRTAKQDRNWINWEEIMTIKQDLADKVSKLNPKSSITENDWNTILKYMVLSLFTDIPPRRNLDYLVMYIVSKNNLMADTAKNYYTPDDPKFIFNRYKTQYKYGQQTESIKDNQPLISTINTYLSFHPNLRGKKLTKHFISPFLVKYSGEPLPAQNSITRILNSIFKKNLGSSLLRHIYLTSKYADKVEDMKKTASAMGHSVSQQRDYILPENIIEPVSASPLNQVVSEPITGGNQGREGNLTALIDPDEEDEIAKIFAGL